MGGRGLDSSGSGQRQDEGCCEDGNELVGRVISAFGRRCKFEMPGFPD